PDHRSGCYRCYGRDAEGRRARRHLAVRGRVAVLAARRIYHTVHDVRPGPALMDRNYYYVGIAFFGMINGLFNQALVPFAYLFAKVLGPALLFGNESLTLMFASLMASTATIIAAGLPATLSQQLSV